MQLYINE